MQVDTFREPLREGTQRITRPSSVTLSSSLVHIKGALSVLCRVQTGCGCRDSPSRPLHTPPPHSTGGQGCPWWGYSPCIRKQMTQTPKWTLGPAPLEQACWVSPRQWGTCVHTHLHKPPHWGLTWATCSAPDPACIQSLNTGMDTGPCSITAFTS